MSSTLEFQECESTSTSSKMVSALASVSGKASKSLFTPISSPLIKQTSEPYQSAQSAERIQFKLNSDISENCDAQKKSFLLSNSISAASSAFNNFISSEKKNNSDPNSNFSKSDQKQKQNLFFKKLEAHSLSLSSTIFGKEVIENHEKMSKLNNNGSNNLSNNATPLANLSGIGTGSIKNKLKPPGTLAYQVEANDTIEKIALKWNTVPSEIQHLNRLVTRVIFPGQILNVPDPNYIPPPPSPQTNSKVKLPDPVVQELKTLNALEKSHNNSDSKFGLKLFKEQKGVVEFVSIRSFHSEDNSTLIQLSSQNWKTTPSSKPGHVELQKQKCLSESSKNSNENLQRNELVSRHTLTEEEAKKLDEECTQRFLKVNCKIVTRSKGCYNGVLI
ncbi:oxidation resistance 1, partial [Brachionus plicatilis]